MLWLFPLVWSIYTSLRPLHETTEDGYFSLPRTLNLDNYVNAWNDAELARYFLNTVIIVVPAVIIVLFLASMMAFACTRYSWRFNLAMLMLFTALNLMPPQIIILLPVQTAVGYSRKLGAPTVVVDSQVSWMGS